MIQGWLLESYVIEVTVEFFGVLRQQAGSELSLQLRAGATVADLMQQLAERFPAAAPRLPQTACAVGDSLVARDRRLRDGQRLVLIPPVSGG